MKFINWKQYYIQEIYISQIVWSGTSVHPMPYIMNSQCSKLYYWTGQWWFQCHIQWIPKKKQNCSINSQKIQCFIEWIPTRVNGLGHKCLQFHSEWNPTKVNGMGHQCIQCGNDSIPTELLRMKNQWIQCKSMPF